MDTSVWFQCRGLAAVESGNRNPALDQFAAGFPEERSRVDFGTRFQTQPTNLFFLFFSDMLALESHWKTGKERKKRREGGKQPQGWREILYACALKHKVCGQLLKDFFRGVKIIHRVNRVKEEKRGCAYASATQFCRGNRETLSAQAVFFSSLLFYLD